MDFGIPVLGSNIHLDLPGIFFPLYQISILITHLSETEVVLEPPMVDRDRDYGSHFLGFNRIRC
jgi:hypothetical protein